MKKLTFYQRMKIKQEIRLSDGKKIVRINVSEEKNLPLEESNQNVYLVDDHYNILWQIKGESHYTKMRKKNYPDDIKTHYDMFTSIQKNERGEITARRFSGFLYRVNIETGETKEIGWNK